MSESSSSSDSRQNSNSRSIHYHEDSSDKVEPEIVVLSLEDKCEDIPIVERHPSMKTTKDKIEEDKAIPLSGDNNYAIPQIVASGNPPKNVSKPTEIIDLSKPADINFSVRHGLAKQVALISGKFDANTETCPCCKFPVGGDKFPLCRSFNLLDELGTSFPLYFKFINFVIVALCICFLVACLPCLIDNSLAGRYYE